MYLVEVFPQACDHKVFPLYAGLYSLENTGEIRVGLSSAAAGSNVLPGRPETLFARVTEEASGRSLLVCFDMVDWTAPASAQQLEACDVYFKRGFVRSRYENLPEHLAKKIKPYGLYASWMSPWERELVKRTAHIYQYVRGPGRNVIPSKHLREHVIALGSRTRLWRRFLPHSVYAEDWGDDRSQRARGQIVFQSRVWDIPDANKPDRLNELNQRRANTVRLLRKEFGERFVGGLIRTPYAERHFPDCLTNMPTRRSDYMRLVKSSLIGISTIGLNESNPCKLAEYLAASRCIVSEPLEQELPTPLETGRHLLEFVTPESCVEACARLLEDPEFAEEMRVANSTYYSEEVQPAALMRNRIRAAFADL